MLSFIEDNVPHNKREKALQLLHENDYSVINTKDFLQQIDPTHVSDWSMEDRERFRVEIFRTRKNFKALCQTMGNKEVGDIIAYYLGHYKKSDDYRLLKTVRMEERIEKAEQATHDVDHCAICGEGGSLLICDGCESEWHMVCAKPALKTVPEGHWECDVCVDSKFLDGRKRILRDIRSNVSVQNLGKRMKSELPSLVETDAGSEGPRETDAGSEGSRETDAGSTDLPLHVIDAVKAFSRNINLILSTPSTSKQSTLE